MSLQTSIVILLLCGIFTSISTKNVGETTKERSGPYVSVVKRFVECKDLLKPYAKDPIAVLVRELKNNTVKGNLTVLRQNRNIQISVQDFYQEDGRWQLTFNAKNITCRNKWLAVLMDLLGIKYNKKNCGVPKGSYLFEVDNNVIDHVWMTTRDYGRILRRVEVNSRDGTVVCFEMECEIIPLK